MVKIGNIKKDNFEIQIDYNPTDDFKHLTLVNGLFVKEGGSPVDYVLDHIVNPLRDKLKRKYPNLKPGDIKNKLKLYINIRFMKNLQFNSQTKERVTNHKKDLDEFFGDKINWSKVVNSLYKNEDLILNITEFYRLKEQAKENAEIKKLEKKTRKKIKSEKYTKSVGRNKLLLICEGQSAKNGLLPGLGRDGIAYYELKGKPMNVYEVSQQKFSSNKELTELYQIIKNEGFEKIAVASDADLDGIQINSLLLAFFNRYLPEFLENGLIYRFQTPVMALLDKNKKPVEWIYDLNGSLEKKPGLMFKYFKGLGGFTPKQLQHIIKMDGLEKCLLKIEKDEKADKTIEEWFSSKAADKRKEKIMTNEFDLIKL
jgi:DNA gyrase subunit B